MTYTYPSYFMLDTTNLINDLAPAVDEMFKLIQPSDMCREDIYRSWVFYHLERDLYLTMEQNDVAMRSYRCIASLPMEFYGSFPLQRELLIRQLRVLQTFKPPTPYSERICRIGFLPDTVRLQFL